MVTGNINPFVVPYYVTSVKHSHCYLGMAILTIAGIRPIKKSIHVQDIPKHSHTINLSYCPQIITSVPRV